MGMIDTYKKFGISSLLVAAVFLPRILDLGTMLTVDEYLWQSRAGQFLRALSVGNFEETLVAGQPGITTAWLAGPVAHYQSLAASQAAIAIPTGILVLIITYFLVYLWGFRWGMLAGFFLALQPFLLAHSRVVHTDALLSLLYIASICALLAGIIPMQNRQVPLYRYIIVSGILGGMALLTKLFALLIIPTVGLIVGITWLSKRLDLYSAFKVFMVWFATFVLTVYIFWPALWLNANDVFTYLTQRTTLHSEGTRAEETTSQPWYYAREILFRLTPVATIFTLIGIIGLRYARQFKDMRFVALMILLSGIIYGVALNTSADKSDRYVLVTILTLEIFAVFGVRTLYVWLKHIWPSFMQYAWVCLLIPVIWLAASAIRIHPYYLAYYNPLYPIEEYHKLGWGEGLELAAAWLTTYDPNSSVASYYPRVFDYFYEGSIEATNHADGKEYLVLYRSMFERGPTHPDTELIQQYLISGEHTPLQTIYINNLPYVWIFKLDETG